MVETARSPRTEDITAIRPAIFVAMWHFYVIDYYFYRFPRRQKFFHRRQKQDYFDWAIMDSMSRTHSIAAETSPADA
jgi:hypothetical protein